MHFNNATAAFTLIGTVHGGGYDCKTNQVRTLEGSTNSLWNAVSFHMEWIQDTMEGMGEIVCKDDQ
jgi:hypothetical protein